MKNIKDKEKKNVSLPCLRGQMGDWMYYLCLMPLREVASIVKLPKEIDRKYDDENLRLGDWIQRKVEEKRIKPIVDYLINQEQRFFNALVLGIYDGTPAWQELNVTSSNIYADDETKNDYYSKTFGILTLSGNESIFAIDGQHRAYGIRKAVKQKDIFDNDEIAVLFVAHSTDKRGKIRTRRLFSTLNRYAKPVSKAEIIALSEDDNCAVITRRIVEDHKYLKGKVLIIKNNSISNKNTNSFTNIIVLYNVIERILTDKKVQGYGNVSGKPCKIYTTVRESEEQLEKDYQTVGKILSKLITAIPSLTDFFINNKHINREDKKTSLLFRPIGQNVLFDVLKVGLHEGKEKYVIGYFQKDDFSLSHPQWNRVFWNDETNDIAADKPRQKFAALLILEKLGFDIRRTKKDKEVYSNFSIPVDKI